MNSIEFFIRKEEAIGSFQNTFSPKEKASSRVNTFFDMVYLINLGKRPDRLVKSLQITRKLGIRVRVFNAIDGKKRSYLSKYEEYRSNTIQKGKKIMIKSPGAWGYLVTWKEIIKDAKKHGYKSFLSFDDDLLFIKDFNIKFDLLTKSLYKYKNNDWKILQLGATQLPHLRNPIDKEKGWFNPGITDGSFATGVHNSVYDVLLHEIYKMDSPLDSGPLRMIYKKYPDKCYVAWPHLVIADVSDSDIRGGKDPRKIAEKLEWDLTHYDNPPLDLISIVIYIPYTKIEHKTVQNFVEVVLNQDYSHIEILIINNNRDIPDHLIKDRRIVSITNVEVPLNERTIKLFVNKKAKGKHIIYLYVKEDKNFKLKNHEIERKIIEILRLK